MTLRPVGVGGLTTTRFTPTTERPLAVGVFEGQLSAMAEHYKTFPMHTYPLPVGVTRVPGIRLKDIVSVKPEVWTEINQLGKDTFTDWAHRAQQKVKSAFQNLQNTGNFDDFDRQIDDAEAEAQKQAADDIHRIYGAIKDAGHANPDLQPQLLERAHQSGNFVSSLVNGFKQFIVDVVNKIREWVAAAVQWVEKAAQDAVNWVEGAISDIGDFFGL